MGRALDAQGRVLDTLSARLHATEQQLHAALGRENEAQSITRDALSTLDEALRQAPSSGFKEVLEKVGASIELLEKVGGMSQAKEVLTQLLTGTLQTKPQQLNGTPAPAPAPAEKPAEPAQPTPPGEQP
jgi:hypothetical protein